MALVDVEREGSVRRLPGPLKEAAPNRGGWASATGSVVGAAVHQMGQAARASGSAS